MLSNNEPPIFVIALTKLSTWKDIKNILKLNTKYNRICLMNENFKNTNYIIDNNAELIFNTMNGKDASLSENKANFIIHNSNILTTLL